MLAGVVKTSTHLALADIRDSIAELRHYREHFLRPGRVDAVTVRRPPDSDEAAQAPAMKKPTVQSRPTM